MKIKLIVFDFGGVIINLDRQACVDRYKELGVENADLMLDNYMQSGIFLELEKGEISLDEFHSRIRQISGQDISDKDIDDAFKAFLLDIPQAKMDKIKELHRHYRTVILSNTNELHFPIKSKKFVGSDYLIEDYFDHCYLSFQMHMSKPDDAIFNSMLEQESVKPEECLYIDDGEQNILAARKLGIKSYWAKNGNWLDEIDNLLQS